MHKINVPLKNSVNKAKANLHLRNNSKNVKSNSSFIASESEIKNRKSLNIDKTTCSSVSKPILNQRNVHLIALNRKKCSTNLTCHDKSIADYQSCNKLSIDNSSSNKYSTVA